MAEELFPPRNHRVLVMMAPGSSVQGASGILEALGVDVNVVFSTSPKDYEELLAAHDFDVVVLDLDIMAGSSLELVKTLHCREHEPSVLLLASFRGPDLAQELQLSSCDRYIFKVGGWEVEVAPAVRALLRVRRVIEENRRLQAKLTEANMFLEAKNRRLDEFSATIAHDIRGPLGGICMKLDYVLEHTADGFNERNLSILKKTIASAMRLTDIVQAMYEYAKIGARRQACAKVRIDTLVREVVEDLNFDDELDIRIGVDCAVEVWAIGDLLRRVFINLIGNAIKYNDKSVKIVNVGVLSTEERALGRFCTLFVEDNGPGIPADECKDLFGMFRRGQTHERTHEGMGVGLAVVQRIIELHFGTVEVQSTPGEGTRFLLSLPIEEIDLLK